MIFEILLVYLYSTLVHLLFYKLTDLFDFTVVDVAYNALLRDSGPT